MFASIDANSGSHSGANQDVDLHVTEMVVSSKNTVEQEQAVATLDRANGNIDAVYGFQPLWLNHHNFCNGS